MFSFCSCSASCTEVNPSLHTLLVELSVERLDTVLRPSSEVTEVREVTGILTPGLSAFSKGWSPFLIFANSLAMYPFLRLVVLVFLTGCLVGPFCLSLTSAV